MCWNSQPARGCRASRTPRRTGTPGRLARRGGRAFEQPQLRLGDRSDTVRVDRHTDQPRPTRRSRCAGCGMHPTSLSRRAPRAAAECREMSVGIEHRPRRPRTPGRPVHAGDLSARRGCLATDLCRAGWHRGTEVSARSAPIAEHAAERRRWLSGRRRIQTRPGARTSTITIALSAPCARTTDCFNGKTPVLEKRIEHPHVKAPFIDQGHALHATTRR